LRAERTPAGGVLYVVATPIGNLDDVTLRALRVLGEVDLIAAEDTRRTRQLLAHHGIRKPVTSYHDAVERARAPRMVAALVAGKRIALVSDAGTPGIADPGYHLVRGAIAAGVPVVPIPGASAVAALVSVAGLPVERFAFEGFPPHRAAQRLARLRALAHEPRAMVFLEAGRRVGPFLDDALAAFGPERECVLGRELTKLHEELARGTLATVRDAIRAREPLPGEATLLIAGAPDAAPAADPASLDAAIRAARAAGKGVAELSADIAHAFGVPRKDVYRRALELERG
jgi:16S rRNA (cytidine1402-2'-O)-methyltransferase